MKPLSLFLLLLLATALPLMAQSDDSDTDEGLLVVATTTQVSDAARNVCRDLCQVVSLIGPGVDPHLYQPTQSDIRTMNRADVVFYNGLHLEGQFDAVFESLGETDVLTYAVTTPAQDFGLVLESTDEAGTADPHIWNHPEVWALAVQGMADTLALLDPDHADAFAANAADHISDIMAVYEWAQAALNAVPEDQRLFVTSHDAFQYYAVAFGWQVAAIQGISTEDEAGVGDIQDTVDFVVTNQLPALFVESSVPPDTIEAVIEGAADRGWQVRLGVRELYSDAMGEAGSFGGTYVGMIAENTLTIVQSYGFSDALPAWPESVEPALPDELLKPDAADSPDEDPEDAANDDNG